MAKKIIKYCLDSLAGSEDELISRYKLYEENGGCVESKIKDAPFQIFNDPIHGPIQLNPLEKAIINTPEFFRLKDIKQLGGLFLVYPGAVHSRFEHSLGVCHIAGEFVKHLRSNKEDPNLITQEEEYCVRLAGLCHDLGHGPFSHLFEEIRKTILKGTGFSISHEQLSILVFKRILMEHPRVLDTFVKFGLTKDHVKMIETMIDPKIKASTEKAKSYLYEIIANKSNGMDVDKWDYFARDCHYLGLTNEFDWRRCMALSSVVEVKGVRHIGYRDKELDNIYGMFRTRSMLHQKAYQHKTGKGIEMMIEEVFILTQNVKLIQLEGVTKSVKDILNDIMDKKDLSGFVCLSDSLVNTILYAPLILVKGNEDRSTDLEKVRQSFATVLCINCKL